MSVLVITGALFSIGLYGVLTRRDVVAILASVEVMMGAALLVLTSVGALNRGSDPATIQAVALLVIVLAAAEAAVGLALLVAVARRMGTTRIDEMSEVKG